MSRSTPVHTPPAPTPPAPIPPARGPRHATVPLALDRDCGVPLHGQLADQVRALIRSGALAPAARVPSTRALAADVGIARSVVARGYDQLLAEGWLVARHGSGTFVGPVGPAHPPPLRAAQPAQPPGAQPTDRLTDRLTDRPERPLVRLDTGTPWSDPRQAVGWRRAWREVSVARPPRGYPDPSGEPDLRRALAGYLARTRGIGCDPDEVLVTSGSTHGLALLLSALPRAHGTLAVEDPGYRAAVATARQADWQVLDVPVDRAGLDVAALAAHRGGVDAVYVTPAHQHPLGVTMTAARRVALLDEARRRSAVVVEDDYDSEFRYDVAPLPALTSLDRDRVVYLGTASKMLLPGLRVGWLVAPAALVARMAELRADRHDHPGWPVQRALLAMLREGHVDRSVRSARRVYAARAALVVARLAPYARPSAPVAGMYVTLLTSTRVAVAVAAEARDAGYDVPLLADYVRSRDRAGLVVGFGSLTDRQLAEVLDVLASSLHRHSRPGDRPDA